MQVPMLTAREELDIGEKTVAAEIDAYFRWDIFFCFSYQDVGVSSLVRVCIQYSSTDKYEIKRTRVSMRSSSRSGELP